MNDLQQVIESLPLQAYKWFRTEDEAYNPNGITDNREEYQLRKSKYLREHDGLLETILSRQLDRMIAKSHDITKSDMGFK